MNTTERRRPGRPSANPEEPARVDIRLSPELRRRVRMAAARADIRLSEWAKRAFLEKLERDGD